MVPLLRVELALTRGLRSHVSYKKVSHWDNLTYPKVKLKQWGGWVWIRWMQSVNKEWTSNRTRRYSICTFSASMRERERNGYVHVIRRRCVCVSWQIKVLVGHKMAHTNSFLQRRPALWRFLTIRFRWFVDLPLAVSVLLFSLTH